MTAGRDLLAAVNTFLAGRRFVGQRFLITACTLFYHHASNFDRFDGRV